MKKQIITSKVQDHHIIINGKPFSRSRNYGPGDKYEIWPVKIKQSLNFISVDVETNGLYGKPYAVSMIAYRNGEIEKKIKVFSRPEEPLQDWLENNPQLLSIPEAITYMSYEDMMTIAAEFYKEQAPLGDVIAKTLDAHGNPKRNVVMKHGQPDYQHTPVLYHCGMIVEGNFFRELVRLGLIGQYDAPMAPIDVADYLRINGFNPHSVESYLNRCEVWTTDNFMHDPEYDAIQAAKAYMLLVSEE